ncbi:uncharacterized protein N7515_001054 [Penicillium bovifimosum]|uniref:Uncharacterized protein n=1 Tax=Penicillium bovifimosum TaxID=126998 RepID=A0A9W9HIP3_9EURO|nr:uncharacterized protein N7515_001054 [Penicillium bovifimosum]KAJ5146490.1 hypothetical protein N7515_001054 [Penicillium bovifimosum]
MMREMDESNASARMRIDKYGGSSRPCPCLVWKEKIPAITSQPRRAEDTPNWEKALDHALYLTCKEKAPVMRSQLPRFRRRRIGREPSEDVVRSKRRRGE